MKKGARILSPFGITQILMAAAVITALCLAYDPWRWGKVKDSVRASFPKVAHIEGAVLTEWFTAKDRPLPVVLDVRSQAEFDAGHLPGAHRLSADKTPADIGFEEKEKTPFVFYCAVGFDSASVASGLILRGYKNVQMLEGGIFMWANDGRAIEGGTGKVNPGNSKYAYLLKAARRAPHP